VWLTEEQQQIWRGYLTMVSRLQTAMHRQLQQDCGLTLPEYEVLVQLSEAPQGKLRPFQLGLALDWEQSRLSHLLTRMSRRGFVVRQHCVADRRGAEVVLTAAGRAAIESAAPGHVTAVRRLVFDRMDREQAAAFGQAITGTLLGTVSDSSGGVVAGANVTVTNMNTGVANSTVTGAEGYYTVPNLAPGKYTVTVQYKGFKTGISEGDVVQVEQTTRVDFTLSTGEITEHVQVSAEVPLVQSTTSDIGSVIEAQQINSLPLNGRLFEQLVTITAGAAAAGWSDFAENPSAAGAVTPTQAVVNGLPWSGNLYLVDGIHNEEPLNAFISITTPLADIQEFKIETSNPTAEYGSFGGAVVNLTTKSGTNQYHGEAFEYIRNDAFNARDFFATTKAPYHAHQFGGAVGGPIRKDKLFFFADYQQLRQHNGVTNTLTVPTALQRQGILTEGAQTAISNPTVCQPVKSWPSNSTTGSPFFQIAGSSLSGSCGARAPVHSRYDEGSPSISNVPFSLPSS